MAAFDSDDDVFDRYAVVMNDEEQYSIWPEVLPIPDGWHVAGPVASRDECLEYVEDHWVDMRPRSLREANSGR
jgi:MbtH protein